MDTGMSKEHKTGPSCSAGKSVFCLTQNLKVAYFEKSHGEYFYEEIQL